MDRRTPIDQAIAEAAAEALVEASCRGPRYGRNTAHLIAERRRTQRRPPTATAYRCPLGDHYHVGATPSVGRLERLARALRGLHPDPPPPPEP